MDWKQAYNGYKKRQAIETLQQRMTALGQPLATLVSPHLTALQPPQLAALGRDAATLMERTGPPSAIQFVGAHMLWWYYVSEARIGLLVFQDGRLHAGGVGTYQQWEAALTPSQPPGPQDLGTRPRL
jgi:hypothetical protein